MNKLKELGIDKSFLKLLFFSFFRGFLFPLVMLINVNILVSISYLLIVTAIYYFIVREDYDKKENFEAFLIFAVLFLLTVLFNPTLLL